MYNGYLFRVAGGRSADTADSGRLRHSPCPSGNHIFNQSGDRILDAAGGYESVYFMLQVQKTCDRTLSRRHTVYYYIIDRVDVDYIHSRPESVSGSKI